MKKDFKLLFKVCVDEITALADCHRRVASREFLLIYKEALKRKRHNKRKRSM